MVTVTAYVTACILNTVTIAVFTKSSKTFTRRSRPGCIELDSRQEGDVVLNNTVRPIEHERHAGAVCAPLPELFPQIRELVVRRARLGWAPRWHADGGGGDEALEVGLSRRRWRVPLKFRHRLRGLLLRPRRRVLLLEEVVAAGRGAVEAVRGAGGNAGHGHGWRRAPELGGLEGT